MGGMIGHYGLYYHSIYRTLFSQQEKLRESENEEKDGMKEKRR